MKEIINVKDICILFQLQYIYINVFCVYFESLAMYRSIQKEDFHLWPCDMFYRSCVDTPGGLLNPKLGIDFETDWESGSGQSSYRRGGHIPIALHLEVVYNIRWLQWPYLNRITELQIEVSTYTSQNNVWDNFYCSTTFWWEAV